MTKSDAQTVLEALEDFLCITNNCIDSGWGNDPIRVMRDKALNNIPAAQRLVDAEPVSFAHIATDPSCQNIPYNQIKAVLTTAGVKYVD
jgi:hypothetical protein